MHKASKCPSHCMLRKCYETNSTAVVRFGDVWTVVDVIVCVMESSTPRPVKPQLSKIHKAYLHAHRPVS